MSRLSPIVGSLLLAVLVQAAPVPAQSAAVTARAAAVPGWTRPLSGLPEVVRGFDPPPSPWLPGHRGVDLAGAAGEPVRSAGAGVVAFAGTVAGVGVVSVDHAGGLRTTYEPVTPSVGVGDPVGVGSPIGVLDPGHPGCPVGACLHWGLRRGATYLDPLALLRPLHVRLKPLIPPAAAGVAG